ncbi:sugar kinase [Aggregatibacter actinomycetemcomitans]|uniref:sugar kinase n=1 Tax=Aggregatibacter actinomycetemcomitans TaxID=714 RepID=UPI00023FEE96|nr:sugar kinase [Aggregatibacter actinomycetemcomitans]EHK91501.1 2-dehydro-3-deoxygluconokinase [Aggregatibacter actinomycetemcomitans RhAA1]KNE78514.1 ketodeoxygluconokinase [Aggregatibacter actinomycetemcomitans RhAA1]MBN6078592.1 sugar kinase [Aggregatibacter actinomycetemcomitans]
MKKIAFIGECMIELNGKPFGEMWQNYGGDTLNSATYLSRMSSPNDIQVYYVSALGSDNLSEQMRVHWQADGINTDWVLKDGQHQPGLYLIQLDEQGERTFLYWRNQSAARYMVQHIDFKKVLSYFENVNMIYLSGISLAILPKTDRTFLVEQLVKLAQKGVQIAFDSNFRPKLWDSLKDAQESYLQLLPYVSLALVTFDDEQLLWDDENERATLTRLHQIGIPKVIVKCGRNGAVFSDSQTSEHGQVVPEPILNVVDTTSAGDSFNAGFLNGYLRNKPLEICCWQGNRVAGIVIQHKGAIIDKHATSHLQSEFN